LKRHFHRAIVFENALKGVKGELAGDASGGGSTLRAPRDGRPGIAEHEGVQGERRGCRGVRARYRLPSDAMPAIFPAQGLCDSRLVFLSMRRRGSCGHFTFTMGRAVESSGGDHVRPGRRSDGIAPVFRPSGRRAQLAGTGAACRYSMTIGISGTRSSAAEVGGDQAASPSGAAARATTQAALPRRASFKLDGITAHRSVSTRQGAVIAENSIGEAPRASTDADAKLCYPNISSCATVTGLTRNGSLRGGHVTTVQGFNKATLETLSTKIGAQDCTTFVVAGPIDNIKSRTTDPDVNTRKKVASFLKDKSPGAEVRFHDTTGRAAPYAIYVGREQHGAGETRLQVHVNENTGAVPSSAALPESAVAVPNGELVRRNTGLF
jgi:hypothetical protein